MAGVAGSLSRFFLTSCAACTYFGSDAMNFPLFPISRYFNCFWCVFFVVCVFTCNFNTWFLLVENSFVVGITGRLVSGIGLLLMLVLLLLVPPLSACLFAYSNQLFCASTSMP